MACLDYRASKDFPEAVNAQPLSNHMATTWLSCSTCYYENITTMPFRWVKHTPTDTWKSQRPSRLCSHTTALFPLWRRSTKRARPQSVLLHQEQQPHGGCGMVRCNGVDCSPAPLEWAGWAGGLGWLLPWELVPKVRAGARCRKSTGNVLTALYSVDKQRAEVSGVVNLSPFSSTKLIFLSV